MKRRFAYIASVTLVLGLSLAASSALLAQSGAPAAGKTFAVIPFEQPNDKDPYSPGVTASLKSLLAQQGLNPPFADPMDHLDAVASAGALCGRYGVNGLLIPEGSYQLVPRYAAKWHIEVRLDLVDCRGNVVWTNTSAADHATSLAHARSGVDDGYHDLMQTALTHLSEAPALPAYSPATAGSPVAAAAAGPATYLVVPVEQPGIAQANVPDMTQPLVKAMTARNLTFKTSASLDHLTTIATAGALCSANGATAIVVPAVYFDVAANMGSLFGGGAHATATLRLDVVSCQGVITTHATGTADGSVRSNGDIVNLVGQAAGPALDQLGSANAAAAPPAPAGPPATPATAPVAATPTPAPARTPRNSK
jgi:hypothetical protein